MGVCGARLAGHGRHRDGGWRPEKQGQGPLGAIAGYDSPLENANDMQNMQTISDQLWVNSLDHLSSKLTALCSKPLTGPKGGSGRVAFMGPDQELWPLSLPTLLGTLACHPPWAVRGSGSQRLRETPANWPPSPESRASPPLAFHGA